MTLASAVAPGFVDIAVDATAVYWTNNKELMSLPLAGGVSRLVWTDANTLNSLATDGTALYWTDEALGDVVSLPLGAAAMTLATARSQPGIIGAAMGRVYWEEISSLGVGSVMSAPIAGGAVEALIAPGSAGPVFPDAISGASLYGGSGENVASVPLAGGTISTLAVEQDVQSIVADANNVYWVAYGGAIKCVPVGGGSVVTLGVVPAGPEGTFAQIAVDATSVYWLDMGPPTGSGVDATYVQGYLARVSTL
jgi:hypothetical protein